MSELSTPKYRRGQLDPVLWKYLSSSRKWGAIGPEGPDAIPSRFRSRIKKLLNLDRVPGMVSWTDFPDDRWAFYDEEAEGTGSEERFSALHGFLLAVALDMVHLGLKQPDVVFILKSIRPWLEDVLLEIHDTPGVYAPVSDTARRPRSFEANSSLQPIRLKGKKIALEDASVWMILRRHGIEELDPRRVKPGNEKTAPIYESPDIAFGLEALKRELFTHLADSRQVMLVELADAAITIPRLLEAEPEVGRGRPKSSIK